MLSFLEGRTPSREPVWLHSQQEHHRHDVCFLTAPREVPGAKQGGLCYSKGQALGVKF